MRRALLVEDDEAIRYVARTALEARGFVVAAVESIADAAALLAAGYLPDVAILDHVLPDGTGAQLCRDLKARAATAATPCVILSALADVDVIARAAGAERWLAKPFDLDELGAVADALAPLDA